MNRRSENNENNMDCEKSVGRYEKTEHSSQHDQK